MHTMREQLMVRMSAVFIYLNGVSLFVKDCRHFTYGAFTFITYFFIISKKKKSSAQNIQCQFSLPYDGRL